MRRIHCEPAIINQTTHWVQMTVLKIRSSNAGVGGESAVSTPRLRWGRYREKEVRHLLKRSHKEEQLFLSLKFNFSADVLCELIKGRDRIQ